MMMFDDVSVSATSWCWQDGEGTSGACWPSYKTATTAALSRLRLPSREYHEHFILHASSI